MNSKGNLTARYALIHGLFQMGYCILGGFVNVYLLDCGFSNSAIGLIVAWSGIFSVCVAPLIAGYLDKPGSISVKKALTHMSFGMLMLLLLIAVTGRSYVLTFISYTAGLTLMQLMASLINSLATQSMRSGWSVDFGAARGCGAFSYGLLAHLLGFAVARFSPGILPLCGAAVWVIVFLYMLRFPDTKDVSVMYAGRRSIPERGRQRSSPVAFFRRYPRYGIFLVGLFFVYISHSLANVFVTQIVISKGGTSADTGLILGVQALVEIPVMLGFSKMLKVAKAHNWMRICAVFYVLKSIGTLLSGNVGAHVAVQFLEIGSFAVMAVSGLYYVNSIMRTEDCVKGQSFMGISTTMANVAASWIGGIMLDVYGVRTTLLLGVAAAVIGMIIMFFSAEQPKEAEQLRGAEPSHFS